MTEDEQLDFGTNPSDWYQITTALFNGGVQGLHWRSASPFKLIDS